MWAVGYVGESRSLQTALHTIETRQEQMAVAPPRLVRGVGQVCLPGLPQRRHLDYDCSSGKVVALGDGRRLQALKRVHRRNWLHNNVRNMAPRKPWRLDCASRPFPVRDLPTSYNMKLTGEGTVEIPCAEYSLLIHMSSALARALRATCFR